MFRVHQLPSSFTRFPQHSLAGNRSTAQCAIKKNYTTYIDPQANNPQVPAISEKSVKDITKLNNIPNTSAKVRSGWYAPPPDDPDYPEWERIVLEGLEKTYKRIEEARKKANCCSSFNSKDLS